MASGLELQFCVPRTCVQILESLHAGVGVLGGAEKRGFTPKHPVIRPALPNGQCEDNWMQGHVWHWVCPATPVRHVGPTTAWVLEAFSSQGPSAVPCGATRQY